MAQESADGYNAMSGDCLKMNIWSPNSGYNPKAVMVWIYGGGLSFSGFERGSINNPAYIGANLAANEDVIVVSFNFRTNIFGFSNAPGTATNNGLRDVRLAIEWIRDNIAAFGGDASRITLFGQSQGAYLISYYAFAFYQDPIAHAFIQQSGSAWSPITQSTSEKASSWKNASAAVGCDQTTYLQVVECMRSQNLSTLVFANYTQRILEHKVSDNPVLMGNNDNEAGFYVFRYGGQENFNLSQAAQDYIGYGLYVCPGAVEAATRANAGYPVYRYEYMGDWPNLELYAGSRAYHTAETSLVFGTMEELSGDPNVELKVTVSRYMQHAWASFSKDPHRGLEELGWPLYNQSGDTLIRLGHAKETSASYVSPAAFDEVCENFE
ncbi:hypothetical protein M409DRAFT_63239 [Zasmidium cellare ATCC 36951]|uniref:Carboxylesterase type B domain-containing protein n=1 Tax=Zasmidium cellare ATCC 36951 TaxID=1080233 RepID=A0A6A6CWV1_ZASCE|nr:uncharacterized protein M409DRAFT_63239 [Zasmidium cellare ATCC 36951]KAF2171591.1 hypothetical protein M409DRAFT_63239 [Zasmidium cellare ATCC 36951]